MQIEIIDRSLPAYLEEGWLRKRIPLNVEQVLPDASPDLKQVAWLDSWLQLTGKHLGVSEQTFSGVAHMDVVYLSEEGELSSLALQKDFSFDLAMELQEGETPPQIRWTVTRSAARALNSRKIAVDLEIVAETRAFRAAELVSDSAPPEEIPGDLQFLHGELDAQRVFAVTERPFTVREQLRFPDAPQGRPQMLTCTPKICVKGIEQLGTKAIVKGDLQVCVWCRDERGAPVLSELRAPFSQLLEIGDTPISESSSEVALCSCSTELIDTIDGGFALDVEARACLQFAAWTEQSVSFIRDAYSTRFDCVCSYEQQVFQVGHEQSRIAIEQDVSLALPEDLQELLVSHATLGLAESREDSIRIPGSADLLYRNASGELDVERRSFALTLGPIPAAEIAPLELDTTTTRIQGRDLLVHLSGSLLWESGREEEVSLVEKLDVGEIPVGNRQTPAVYLVRSMGEDRWTLAKRYRSSVAAIEEMNGPDQRVLLIPAEG